MRKRKVLLVVEGERKELDLFEKLFAEYSLDADYEIYPYQTNIYELYERMFEGGDAEGLSFLGILREKASEADRYLFEQDYSDTLLVFDYDPQDNRFSRERLEVMLSYFNESTDEGKLYINYPMIEACKHFSNMPDYEFLERTVDVDAIPDYKAIVGKETSYQSLTRDAGKHELSLMIGLVAARACMLAKLGENPKEAAGNYRELDHRDILEKQGEMHVQDHRIAVLGTCLLFIADYSLELADLDWVIKALFGR